MKRFLLTLAVTVALVRVGAAQDVRAYEGADSTLPTYLLDPAEKAPIFERDWSYQRAKRSVYPYPLNDNMTRKKEDVTYDCLYMENEYVKLCVLPEIGGRLLYAVDKTNGYDIFYRNSVVKPANVGMTGAWISGGVELGTPSTITARPAIFRVTGGLSIIATARRRSGLARLSIAIGCSGRSESRSVRGNPIWRSVDA